MWIQTIYLKYVNNRHKKTEMKISVRLAEIDADLPKQLEAIKSLRIRRDNLKCATSTLEHDEFMNSAVEQLNEEIRHRQHLAKSLADEQDDLNVRMDKLPGHLEVANSPTLAYS